MFCLYWAGSVLLRFLHVKRMRPKWMNMLLHKTAGSEWGNLFWDPNFVCGNSAISKHGTERKLWFSFFFGKINILLWFKNWKCLYCIIEMKSPFEAKMKTFHPQSSKCSVPFKKHFFNEFFFFFWQKCLINIFQHQTVPLEYFWSALAVRKI